MNALRAVFKGKNKKIVIYLAVLLVIGVLLQVVGGSLLGDKANETPGSGLSGGTSTGGGASSGNGSTTGGGTSTGGGNTNGGGTSTGGGNTGGGTSAASGSYADIFDFERALEQRLEDAFSTVQDAGRVKVLISLASDKEMVYAVDANTSESYTQETDAQGGSRETANETSQGKTVMITDAAGIDQPLVVKEIEPKIAGVVIIAEGGDDIFVKDALTKAACTLLGVEVNKVQILKMRGE